MRPVVKGLKGFGGSQVQPLGTVFLTMMLGSKPQTVTCEIPFLVIDEPFEYNVLMGRPTLNQFKAVPSTYHMRLKFRTKRGTGQVLGDRREAWECYSLSTRRLYTHTLARGSHQAMDVRKQPKRPFYVISQECNHWGRERIGQTRLC